MTRAESHIKETIACRAFEYALDPNFVVQTSRQGSDYGIDYFIQAFSKTGQLERQFGAQVKYVPNASIQPCSVESPFANEENVFAIDHRSPPTTKIRIRKSQLRDWLDKTRNPAEVVLVAANENAIFYVWIDDLADHYLNWIPGAFEGTGTTTLMLSGVRCIYPERQPSPHSHSTPSRGWFGQTCLRGMTDSVVNISSVALLQSWNYRPHSGKLSRVQEYFYHILKATASHPIALPRFAKFIRNQPDSRDLSGWAISTLKAWSSAYEVPAALYLLSSCASRKLCEEGLAFLNSVERPHHYLHAYRELLPRNLTFDSYLVSEYLNSVACFLYSAATECKIEDAQECLVRSFFNFDYSLPIGNIYAYWLSHGVRTESLLKGNSLESLSRMCNLVCPNFENSLLLAIPAVSSKWANEERDSK